MNGRVPAYVAEYLVTVDDVPLFHVVAPSGSAPAVKGFSGRRHGRPVIVRVDPVSRLCATCWGFHGLRRRHAHDGVCGPGACDQETTRPTVGRVV